jgi:hypothetical protein
MRNAPRFHREHLSLSRIWLTDVIVDSWMDPGEKERDQKTGLPEKTFREQFSLEFNQLAS